MSTSVTTAELGGNRTRRRLLGALRGHSAEPTSGTTSVTEFEVLEGKTILGEKENLSDGLSGSFSLTLDASEYTLYCPGGSDERGTLTVSGKTAATSTTSNEAGAVEK